MNTYQGIVSYYDRIFPLNRKKVDFVLSALGPRAGDASLLEAGCGTGSLSLALADRLTRVVAIDLEEEMIREALRKAADLEWKPEFLSLDMLTIKKHFTHQSFDAVACFGNTLVHLPGLEEIGRFLDASRRVLKENGALLLQIVNYRYILDSGVRSLPVIENDTVRFLRFYDLEEEGKRIRFRTVLEVKRSGRVIESSVDLCPLERNVMEKLLVRSGFRCISVFENFNRKPVSDTSLSLVVEAH